MLEGPGQGIIHQKGPKNAALAPLLRFLSWNSVVFIVETAIIDTTSRILGLAWISQHVSQAFDRDQRLPDRVIILIQRVVELEENISTSSGSTSVDQKTPLTISRLHKNGCLRITRLKMIHPSMSFSEETGSSEPAAVLL